MKDRKRAVLILLAFIAGGAVPIQLVTLSFGYAQYIQQVSLGPKVIITAHEFAVWYVPFVYIPALLLLIGIAWYSRSHYPDVFRRIIIGLGVGVLATVSLDFFREMGVINSWLAGDTPKMFGKMVTGSSNFAYFYPIGFFVHLMNGANFGLFYTFVWGRRGSYKSAIAWATLWALVIELGMMTLPPIAPMLGAFGSRFAWPELFLLTLVAHLAFGITLGILSQYFLRSEDEGGLFRFLRGHQAEISN
ncbi:MAG: hypothetical protein BMS9Abin05_0008 [Rhodothermia bacterium]|nr:MAG: hypothetical protein BMS9Abin05_0008 [Rhodothermia bacterium]